jgi:hypothetical protein
MKSKIGSVDKVADTQYNLFRKVFPSKAWDDLISGLRRKAFSRDEIAGDTVCSLNMNSDITKNHNDKMDGGTTSGKDQRTNKRPKKSLSFLLRTNVLPNPAICIRGNHPVEILFIVNSYSAEWESLLPTDTQQRMSDYNLSSPPLGQQLMEINAEPTNLWNFPYIPVSRLKFSPLLVGLLAQQATWNIFQNKSEIEDLLS